MSSGERLHYATWSSMVSQDNRLRAVRFVSDDSGFLTRWDGQVLVRDSGRYGQELFKAAYALLTDEQRAEVERERIRYWEVDPALLQ